MENDSKEIAKKFEEKVREDLTSFLQYKKALDPHVPECPDVEEKWTMIGRAYLPDGAKEFQEYPVVSLGWIMFVGMAMAYTGIPTGWQTPTAPTTMRHSAT